jgi:drug/metabolite transporter (DMT)-like permease
MSGITIALLAGLTFGLFQTVNRRTNQLLDAYLGTFLTLVVGLVVLGTFAMATQDLGELGRAPLTAYLGFAAAGIVHFFFGWTFLSLSQQRIGAARTGALVAAAPLFGTLIAALALSEPVTLPMLGGVVLVTAGLVVLSIRHGTGAPGATTPWFGLAAALSWGSSPLFIRWGLERLPVPLLGVTVGLLAASVTYGIALLIAGNRRRRGAFPTESLRWVGASGTLVGIAIALQWTSYDMITIAVALTLMQIATPVVIVAAPVVVGSTMERPTFMMLVGAAAVMAGSTIVVLAAGA